MRVSVRRLAALLAAALLLAGGAAAWKARGRARHLAVPVLADPTLPVAPGVELADTGGCESREVTRVGGRVTALLEDRAGALWVGTFDGGLFRARPSEALEEIPGLRGRERFVNALDEHDGLVWVATQGGLVALDGERRAFALLSGEGVATLARAVSGLYAGTARGVFRISVAGGAEPLEATGPTGEPLRVTALAVTATHLWIGTASGAYSLPLATAAAPLLARAARWHPLVFGDPPAQTNVVTALAPLGDGVVAGTDDGGVVRLREHGAVSALRFADPRANEVNPGAAADVRGGVAVGTQGGGVLLVRTEGGGLAAERIGAPGRAEVSALHPSGGRLLAGTASGEVVEVRCGAAGPTALTRRASAAPARAAP
jgi:ligand-binding sensor domain-containing protein